MYPENFDNFDNDYSIKRLHEMFFRLVFMLLFAGCLCFSTFIFIIPWRFPLDPWSRLLSKNYCDFMLWKTFLKTGGNLVNRYFILYTGIHIHSSMSIYLLILPKGKQKLFFFLNAVLRGWWSVMSFILSELFEKPSDSLIFTDVPILVYLLVCFSDQCCPRSTVSIYHFRRPLQLWLMIIWLNLHFLSIAATVF